MPFSCSVIYKCRQNHVSNSHLNRMLIFPTTCASLLVVLFHEPAEHEDRIRTCCTQVFFYIHLMLHDYDATRKDIISTRPFVRKLEQQQFFLATFVESCHRLNAKVATKFPFTTPDFFLGKKISVFSHESWIFLPYHQH